jgi:hypothetical protein
MIFWGNPCAFFLGKEFPPQMRKIAPMRAFYSELSMTIHAAALKRSVLLRSLLGPSEMHILNLHNLLSRGNWRPIGLTLPVGHASWN